MVYDAVRDPKPEAIVEQYVPFFFLFLAPVRIASITSLIELPVPEASASSSAADENDVSSSSAEDGCGGGLAFGDHESAPDGEVGLPMQRAVVGAVGGERHSVGVEVQHSPGIEGDVVLREGDRYSPAEHYLAGIAQPFPPGFHLLGLDRFRAVPLESEQDRGQRAVAAAGRRRATRTATTRTSATWTSGWLDAITL